MQRVQHKSPFHHAWVGQGQLLGLKLQGAIQQQIQIQRARGIAVGSFAAGRLLYFLQLVQQIQRAQSGFYFCNTIGVVRAA